ncbi:M15 family metallopeptidase [Stenotrophomonas bentonitica]|uniref:M15 family metallopeptidase n=1 Tax=Stenotrophomonas bentonitica TaxID=1450134 RepID=UPI00345E7028
MTSRTCTSPVPATALSLLLALAAPLAIAQPVTIALVRTTEQAGLVDIRTLAPDIQLDMRYATANNFTGRPVPGYDAPKCFLLRPAATALAQVEADLRARGYGLQLFDCYRPAQSVRAFVDWANDPLEQSRKATQYPSLEKPALLGEYIAETSGHSRGATVDLGLLDCRRDPCTPVDMGTDFDFFGPRAHTDAPDVTPAQHQNRHTLLQAMQRRGFANYPQEWWHFTLSPEPAPGTAYDVPVR